MIYLCSVYSINADAALMQKRYEYAAKRTAEFMKDGHTVFCPINHCHPIAEKYGMPRTWDFWKQHDLNYIDAADEVWVLMMPHWNKSVGISAEIKHAEETGKTVVLITADDYEESEYGSETTNEITSSRRIAAVSGKAVSTLRLVRGVV